MQEEILQIIGKVLQKEVEMDTRLLAGGDYVDSLNIVALLVELEDTYGISFSEDIELDFLESAGSLADHVINKIKK